MKAAAGGAKAMGEMPPAEGESVLWLAGDRSDNRGDSNWLYG